MQITFAGALGLLFIGLKLGGVISWPWVWVLAPFWIGVALFIVIAVPMLLLAGARPQRSRRLRNR